MRVDSIKIYNPIFTSTKRSEQKTIIPISRPDSFEHAEVDFETKIKNCYSKMQKSMSVVTPQDIIIKANYVSKKTGVPLGDVYNTMGVLSQYSSYKSLKFLENSLYEHNINSIYLLPISLFDKNIPLSNVLAYICSKNLPYNNFKDALMIDSTMLKTVKNMNSGDKKLFKNYIKDNNLKLLYIENFENGNNFLNQKNNFENYTVEVLQKALNFQKKNGKSLDYNVRYFLNRDNYKHMKVLSYAGDIEVIKPNNNAYTPELIADNLNPIMPSFEEFKSVIKQISKGKQDVEKDVLKFLNKTLTVVSPQQYVKYFKDIHQKLLKYLDEQGRTMDDVYFVVPTINKSFTPANYVYTKANNIENPKYVFMDEDYYLKCDAVENLPDNSVAIVLDDCILSGMSMKDENFPYVELSDSLSKDKKIIFAPIVCLNLGKNMIENIAKSKNRDDKVIYGKLLPDFKMKSKNLTLVRDISTGANITTSVVFPYMGPDYNCDELVPLYEKFLFNKRAQKVCIGDINEFTLG